MRRFQEFLVPVGYLSNRIIRNLVGAKFMNLLDRHVERSSMGQQWRPSLMRSANTHLIPQAASASPILWTAVSARS